MRWLLVLAVLGFACSKTEDRNKSDDYQIEVLETYDTSDPRGGDLKVLEQLKKAGADLSKPTHVIHYVYFPTEEAAQKAKVSVGQAFSVDIRRSSVGDTWSFVAEHTIVPSIENITTAREVLEKAAAAESAEYDGWEAAITR